MLFIEVNTLFSIKYSISCNKVETKAYHSLYIYTGMTTHWSRMVSNSLSELLLSSSVCSFKPENPCSLIEAVNNCALQCIVPLLF